MGRWEECFADRAALASGVRHGAVNNRVISATARLPAQRNFTYLEGEGVDWVDQVPHWP
jgi:hypothetical protein